MKRVSLQQITLQNFKSFRQETTIQFNQTGLILISGDNRAEPRLGANGAGKTTIFDALCFVFYGVAINGDRASDIITYGQQETSVIVLLTVDNELLTIERTSPPSRLYVNEERVEENWIEANLKLSRTQFLNSVLFGQAAPLFIDLPIPTRGELLDDILDLELWMRAAEVASKQLVSVTKGLTEIRTNIARIEGQIAGIEDLSILQQNNKEWVEDHNNRVEILIQQLEAKEIEQNDLQAAIDNFEASWDIDTPWKAYQEKEEHKTKLSQQKILIEDNIKRTRKDIEFFQTSNVCPVCTQDITKRFADQHLEEQTKVLESLGKNLDALIVKYSNAKDKSLELYKAWQAANEQKNIFQTEQKLLSERLKTKKKEVAELEKIAQQLLDEKNPYEDRLQIATTLKQELTDKLSESRKIEESTVSRISVLDFWKQGFRRVRLFCIKRVLQQLEIETMNAAVALGLIGWKIAYTTETETKSGTLKTGIQIEVQSPVRPGKFSTWSGGEGQRVRLCIALGLAGLIQRWAGVIFDFEVFDEPSSWLSESGIEDLLETLHNRAEAYGKTIYICDHRALIYSGFSAMYNIIKEADGSRLEML